MLHKGPLRVEKYLDILIIKVTQENDDHSPVMLSGAKHHVASRRTLWGLQLGP